MWLTAILVFLAVAVLETFWTHYFLATTNRIAARAAHFSALIMGTSGAVTYAYNHEGLLLIPAVVGAWVGTYLATKYHKD